MTTTGRSKACAILGCTTIAIAGGLVAGAAPAQGTPNVPLAPACQFQLPDYFELTQDDNILVDFSLQSNRASGPVQYRSADPRNAIPTGGKANGALNSDGRTFLFIVNWNEGPGNGLNNNYYGTISDDGSVSGWTTNSQGTRNNWTAKQKAKCVAPPNTGPGDNGSAPPQQGPQQAALPKITGGDVDLYTQPGGVGSPVGVVKNGTSVDVLERRPDNWVHVSFFIMTKQANGWVWGDYVPST